jgi:hypothetical protein
MERRTPAGLHSQWRVPEPLRDHVKLAAMVATAVMPLMLLTWLLPRPLVLPGLCIIAIVGACAASLYAWTRGTNLDPRRVTPWDVAGALAFIGFAAGMLSNPEHVVHFADSATLRVRE